jgi:hypothetical protein
MVKNTKQIDEQNKVEIETIFDQNTRKYDLFKFDFETIMFLIGFIINIIQIFIFKKIK